MSNNIYQSDFTGPQMDERFAAVAELQTAVEGLQTAVAAKYVKPASGIPSTDLDADVNAALAKALTAVQSLADYYTKAEIDAMIAALNSMEYVDVATLPDASASTMGKIYLVGPDGSGYYSYYISSYDDTDYSWVGPLGTTEISLANYATKAELNQLDQEVTDLANLPVTGYFLKQDNTYTSYGGNNAGYFLRCAGKSTYKITSVSGRNVIFAFVKSLPTASGDSADYATGASRQVVYGATPKSGNIPSDAVYLYVSKLNSGANVFPTGVILDGYDYVLGVHGKLGSLQEQETTLAGKIDETDVEVGRLMNQIMEDGYGKIADTEDISDSEYFYILNGTSVSRTATAYGYKGLKFPCAKGDKFIISTYGGTNSGRAFGITDANGLILEVAGSDEQDFISNPKQLTITQDDAAFLYVNCYVSTASYLAAFYVKKYGKYVNRLDAIEAHFVNGLAAKGILLLGASFAYSANAWFAAACEKLGLTGINEAVSGSNILDDAYKLIQGTLFTNIEDFDILAIMHTHDFDVNTLDSTYQAYTWEDYEDDPEFVAICAEGSADISKWYACAFDYVLKKYAYLCYQCKDDEDSHWYNTQYGKPAIVAICSSWHDARQRYNSTSKLLATRWGHHYIDIASGIGFSCQTLSPATGAQPSILYAQDTQNQTFEMGGESVTQTVGWHPYRGEGSWTQARIAEIFREGIARMLW